MHEWERAIDKAAIARNVKRSIGDARKHIVQVLLEEYNRVSWSVAVHQSAVVAVKPARSRIDNLTKKEKNDNQENDIRFSLCLCQIETPRPRGKQRLLIDIGLGGSERNASALIGRMEAVEIRSLQKSDDLLRNVRRLATAAKRRPIGRQAADTVEHGTCRERRKISVISLHHSESAVLHSKAKVFPVSKHCARRGPTGSLASCPRLQNPEQ